mmetsp:Transcript_66554/g.188949  ORF Transcript_66554/g.188949 Transcript_66554/m.188949 type:complete len:548 (+) Transcript_66554:56-1699(+)
MAFERISVVHVAGKQFREDTAVASSLPYTILLLSALLVAISLLRRWLEGSAFRDSDGRPLWNLPSAFSVLLRALGAAQDELELKPTPRPPATPRRRRGRRLNVFTQCAVVPQAAPAPAVTVAALESGSSTAAEAPEVAAAAASVSSAAAPPEPKAARSRKAATTMPPAAGSACSTPEAGPGLRPKPRAPRPAQAAAPVAASAACTAGPIAGTGSTAAAPGGPTKPLRGPRATLPAAAAADSAPNAESAAVVAGTSTASAKPRVPPTATTTVPPAVPTSINPAADPLDVSAPFAPPPGLWDVPSRDSVAKVAPPPGVWLLAPEARAEAPVGAALPCAEPTLRAAVAPPPLHLEQPSQAADAGAGVAECHDHEQGDEGNGEATEACSCSARARSTDTWGCALHRRYDTSLLLVHRSLSIRIAKGAPGLAPPSSLAGSDRALLAKKLDPAPPAAAAPPADKGEASFEATACRASSASGSRPAPGDHRSSRSHASPVQRRCQPVQGEAAIVMLAGLPKHARHQVKAEHHCEERVVTLGLRKTRLMMSMTWL